MSPVLIAYVAVIVSGGAALLEPRRRCVELRQEAREVLAAYEDYIARELERGTRLRAMTRHLSGMRSGRAGGRHWRRALGELGDGGLGLAALRRLVGQFASAAVPSTV